MGRSPGFGSAAADLFALLRLGFPSAPDLESLTSPAPATRRTVLQKVRHPPVMYRSLTVWRHRVSGSSPFLHSTLLYRSIRVFSLGGWSLLLPTGFPVSRGTLVSAGRLTVSPTRLSRSSDRLPRPVRLQLTVLYADPQPRNACTPVWAPSRSLAATWDIEFSFFSSAYLDVSVQRVSSVRLCIHRTVMQVFCTGFPHSDISGSKGICPSPKLFAACYVLHRPLLPRHPPCALYV